MVRRLAICAVALGVCTPGAGAAEGTLQLVSNHPAPLGSTEIEVAGDMAFVVGFGGLEIVSIRDPARPVTLSQVECQGSVDVALDPAAEIAVLAIDARSVCLGGEEGLVVLDIRDPSRPETLAEVRIPAGVHTVTMDGRTLYANQPDETLGVRSLGIYDLSRPEAPQRLSAVEWLGHGAHDSYVRHRPDGRTLLYTANVFSGSSVVDVSDPRSPEVLQSVYDPRINYAHQAEITHDDRVIMVSDETLIGSPTAVCGKSPAGAVDVAGLHFYAAAPDGTFADAGLAKLGTWNVELQPSGIEKCSIHVFVQSPDSRRVLAAWYTRGTRLADISDPAAVQELAAYVPDGGAARQSIPHNGLIYVADLERGMDVLRHTGDGWPADAGPAEAHRFGAAAPAPGAGGTPAPPAPAARPAGRAAFGARFRVPRRVRRVGVAIRDARGVQVAFLRARVRPGRRARLRVRAKGLPGRYSWRVAAAGRRLARGRFAIEQAAHGVTLPAGVAMRARLARR